MIKQCHYFLGKGGGDKVGRRLSSDKMYNNIMPVQICSVLFKNWCNKI